MFKFKECNDDDDGDDEDDDGDDDDDDDDGGGGGDDDDDDDGRDDCPRWIEVATLLPADAGVSPFSRFFWLGHQNVLQPGF